MADWFKTILGAKKVGDIADVSPAASADPAAVSWLPHDKNAWGVPVLDVRPITLTMLSTSKDPKCATNAVSFRGDDGKGFIGVAPKTNRSAPALLRYPIDRYLADGALFIPTVMEHKWAIFLHRGHVVFVRSWVREVVAAAQLDIANGFATITRIDGTFTAQDEEPTFTARVADFLMRSHGLGMSFPAPLPDKVVNDPKAAALWCMSCFGRMAEFATPHLFLAAEPTVPLRTHSLLHIAVARAAVLSQLDLGLPVDLLAKDGFAPLHWAPAGKTFEIAELLLSRGSPVDVRSAELATPLMNAAQAGSLEWTDYLLARGADPNARDQRGFTAMHRAAETGNIQIVKRLLDAGGRSDVDAGGHTPLSLAQVRNHIEIVRLLAEA